MLRLLISRAGALLLALMTAVQALLPWVKYPSPTRTADEKEILEAFNDRNGRIMSMSHRGDWKNYPENSLPAIKACIDMGVDIVEIDVRLTADGVVVLSHDETLDRKTNGSGRISEMTYKEISRFYLKEGEGGWLQSATNNKMPTLAQVLQLYGGKAMFYLDYAMSCKDEVRDVLDEYGCLDSCFFVDDTPYAEVKEWFDSLRLEGKDLPMFGCKIKNADAETTNAYIGSFLAGGSCPIAEISFDTDERATAKPETYELARTGMRTIGTTLGGEQCAGREDDETGWSYLIALGCNVIQTDHIQEFVLYADAVNSTRAAGSVTEAEHFTGFSGVELTDADMSLNKYVRCGESSRLEYNNILFNGTERTITVTAYSLLGAKIEVFVDGASQGVVSVTGGVSFAYRSISLSGMPTGEHTVCLKTTGRVVIDSFTFK